MLAEPQCRLPRSAPAAAALALVITIAAGAAPARAFPFLQTRVGNTPFEGPADWEATSIWWNPAALARVRGLRLTLHGLGEIGRGAIARHPIFTATGRPAVAGDGGDRTFPEQSLASETWSGFGALTWNFNENVTVALGVLAPWLSCPRTASCRSSVGGARAYELSLPSAYHQTRESFTTIYFSGAAAFRVSSRIFIGVALSIVDSFDEYDFYRDAALDGGSTTVAAAGGHERPGAAQRITIRGSGGTFWGTSRTAGLPSPTGVSTHLALLVRPTERLWVGASYQHVFPTSAGGFGTASAVGATLKNPGGECAGEGGCWGGAALQYVLPDVWQAGARIFITESFEISTWGRLVTYGGYTRDNPAQLGRVIRLSGDVVTRGKAPSQIVIDHGLIPQFSGEFGVRWQLHPRLRLGASLVMTTSAVRQSLTSAAAFDAPKVDLTVGAQWQVARWLRLIAGYGLTFFYPIDVDPGDQDPSAAVACVDRSYDVDVCQPSIQGRALPSNAGRYTMTQHHLSLGLSLDFY